MKFAVEHGMLQARDINPAVTGLTTKDLTNPVVEAKENVNEELITGKAAQSTSPLNFVIAAALILFVINLLQE